MAAHDDDEATAQLDLEALRRQARASRRDDEPVKLPRDARDEIVDSEALPAIGVDEPGPDSMTRMDYPRKPPVRSSFADDEHTANDLQIPSMARETQRGLQPQESEAEPFALAKPQLPPAKPQFPARTDAAPMDYAAPKVTIQEGESGNWNPGELLDEVVSSAVRSPRPPERPSVDGVAFAKVPERAIEVVHVKPARQPYADPWATSEIAAARAPVSVSFDEPTIVPRIMPRDPDSEPPTEARIDDATIVPMPGRRPAEIEAEIDAEPNTIVPRLMPRDRNGRIAYEPSLAAEDLSNELLVERTGSDEVDSVDDPDPGTSQVREEPEDFLLTTGDFESFDPNRSGAMNLLETGQRRAFDPAFAPSISMKGDRYGAAEDLATDPSKSLAEMRGYSNPEDLATDPQRSLRSLRSFADESARAHFDDPDDDPSSRTEVPPAPDESAYTPQETAVPPSAWPQAVSSESPHARSYAPEHHDDLRHDDQDREPPDSARDQGNEREPELVSLEASAAIAEAPRSHTALLVSNSYQPKSSVKVAPVWQSEADPEERALQDQQRWEDLCELLLSRLDRTPSPVPRARLLLRLAGVLEDRMSDFAQAFDGMLEAYGSTPDDPQIVERLEGLATRLDKFPALIDMTMERLGNARPSERIALLANAIRWYEGPIGRPDAAGFYVSELERADASHPVLLVRKANAARARGDHQGHLEMLQRALERTRLPRERMALHIAVGEAQRIPSEAIRHFEAAIEIDPTNVSALLSFERSAQKFDRYAEVEWSLKQLIAHAKGQLRIDAHLRLADLLEKRFLKREEAAGVLRTLLQLVPGHREARISLEKCYLALRDFPRLVEAAGLRGASADTPREQGEAYAFAADIAETKLGDQVSAADNLRRATDADPTNETYLTRAAKLAERMQDPHALADYRGRLADILQDPVKRAQQYLAIAAMLDEPLAQRGYYERATRDDPSCAAAWEGLERIARELGDGGRAIAALRGRIEATESQRVKAQLWVELGAEHARAGDDAAATAAYDAGFRADPSNERAATAVLDALVAEGRFAEALPACELLVTAASRDRDSGLLYGRLRTSAKIAIGLGDLAKALGACVAAMDALPHERQPLIDVIEIMSRAPADSPLGPRADVAFERMLVRSAELEPDMLAKLGKLLASRGENARAVEVLLRVLDGADDGDAEATGQRPVPGDGRALFEVLSEALVATGDLARAADMKIRLSRVETSEDARYAALVSAIEILSHSLGDLPATRPVVEEALLLRPDDHWLLHTAMWLFGELDEWARLAEVLERIVRVQETPERRAKALFSFAQIVGDKLGDKARAADLYDQTLDADKTRLDAFEAQTRALDDISDFKGMEKAYRKMIARVRDDGDDELVFTLFRNLAQVYKDRLGDAELAAKALEGAKRVKPGDSMVKSAAVEILISQDELDKAVTLLRADLERDPYDRKSYELLYGVFLRQAKFDRALSTAQVLAELRAPTEEEARFLADYPPFALGVIPGSLVEEAWASHLYHRDLDPMLTSIFAWMTPAVCRMQEAAMSPDERMASFGKPLTRQLTRHADTIRQTFSDSCEILACVGPELLVARSARNLPFSPAKFPYGAMLVSPESLAGTETILPYLVGKRLAEQRPELAARGFFPAVSELTSMLATAVRVGLGERGSDPAAQKLDRALYQVMTDDERAAVNQAVSVAQAEGGKLDVRRWSQAADISSMRVGLLLAQDVRIAKRAVSAEPQGPSDLTPREKLGELYLFATGDLYADLRQAVGVNLADGGPTSSAIRG